MSPADTGFETVERLLDEARVDGRSATLEAWLARARETLGAEARSAFSPARRADAARLLDALALAAQLFEALRAPQRSGV